MDRSNNRTVGWLIGNRNAQTFRRLYEKLQGSVKHFYTDDIPPKREHFITLDESSGIEALKSTLDLMQPAVKPTNVIVPGASAQGNGEQAKWGDLSQEQRVELRTNDLETYKKLYKAEYGVEAKIDV